MYAGWFIPNSSTTQYNYPIFVGGSARSSSQLISGTADSHKAYWNSVSSEFTGSVNDGITWIDINFFLPKASSGQFNEWQTDLDGNRVLYNMTIIKVSTSTIYGDLEGMYAVTNGDSSINLDDILNTGAKGLLGIQDTFRTGAGNVILIDLEGDA